jgi:hypothetical protein
MNGMMSETILETMIMIIPEENETILNQKMILEMMTEMILEVMITIPEENETIL